MAVMLKTTHHSSSIGRTSLTDVPFRKEIISYGAVVSVITWKHFLNIEIFEPTNTGSRTATWLRTGLLENGDLLRNTVGSHYFKDLSELHLLQLLEVRSLPVAIQFPKLT
ncbi:unnamed protein product [Orchesella dallaii]|uniref:Uncharacterized protein n=1 Tax=Orchesella dallaii TaxID=48710 RepID=A0ABP1RUV5_9HEXA